SGLLGIATALVTGTITIARLDERVSSYASGRDVLRRLAGRSCGSYAIDGGLVCSDVSNCGNPAMNSGRTHRFSSSVAACFASLESPRSFCLSAPRRQRWCPSGEFLRGGKCGVDAAFSLAASAAALGWLPTPD